jgi:membrane-associated phospholipid phosphatase
VRRAVTTFLPAVLAFSAGLATLAGVSIASPQKRRVTSQKNEARVAVAPPNQSSSDPVIEWNRILNTLQATPGVQPATVQPTYDLAVTHAAIYDAVVSIDHSAKPYLFRLAAPRDASLSAAADTAAHDALVALYPSQKSTLDQDYGQLLGKVDPGARKDAGVVVGRVAAAGVLALRANDGSQAPLLPDTAGTQPGDFQPVPPNHTNPPQFDQWRFVTPFVLNAADRFRPAPPPALSSTAYADAINEVKSLGIKTGATRTADQTQIGTFWNPSPWATFNQIAQTAAITRGSSLSENARTFALLNLTLADTAIAFYDAKYTYNFWRPVTAITSANTGNPAVVSDPNWTPLVATANDPSYPGAHSAIGAASAVVLSSIFGPKFDFAVTSSALPGVEGSFASFPAAGKEAGLSRIFAGVHTRLDHVAGKRLGTQVAHFVVDNFLTPRGDSKR